jgi:hypothetical protein
VFAELKARWSWRPIVNCPGRFVFAAGPIGLPPEAIVEGTVTTRRYHVAPAPDPVVVLWFDDGGLISYVRPDGTYLHTLNTREGFERKLAQLGIAARQPTLEDTHNRE